MTGKSNKRIKAVVEAMGSREVDEIVRLLKELTPDEKNQLKSTARRSRDRAQKNADEAENRAAIQQTQQLLAIIARWLLGPNEGAALSAYFEKRTHSVTPPEGQQEFLRDLRGFVLGYAFELQERKSKS